jgi:hypothetical protein
MATEELTGVAEESPKLGKMTELTSDSRNPPHHDVELDEESPLMTRLPCSPGSTLVLRLNQETIHDFILLFMPPCDPHLTPLATGSLERSLLVFSTPGGLTGDDLSRLFFTCTNTSQAATCTCNT